MATRAQPARGLYTKGLYADMKTTPEGKHSTQFTDPNEQS